MRPITLTALVVSTALVFAACGDDDLGDAVDRAREDLEDVAGAAGARAAAEAVRGVLLARDLDDGETLRDMTVLRGAVDDVPGDPQVTKLRDRDRDGKDDDGRVELRVGDQRACVEVADNGEVDVSGGACEPG